MRTLVALATFSLWLATLSALSSDIPPPATAVPTSATPGRAESLSAAKTLRQKGRVERVVDGDTVDVRLTRSSRVVRVRMLGIDTPEVHGTVECGGPEASRWLKKKLPVDTQVRLVSDPTQDRKDQYGRALRYVIGVSDGADLNRGQLRRGNATVFVWDSNPFVRVTGYRAAQRRAKAAGRGIWGHC